MSRILSYLEMRLMWGDDGKPLKNRVGRQMYYLLSNFVYQSDIAAMTFVVPQGFITDLASVPRLPFVYWSLGDMGQEPAVVHDFLYSTQIVPRKLADQVLREALVLVGVGRFKAYLFYLGVRAGGGNSYRPPA